MSYGLPASIASISWVGFRNCDYAIVSARLGAVQAGYYFRAYMLAVEYRRRSASSWVRWGSPCWRVRARSSPCCADRWCACWRS